MSGHAAHSHGASVPAVGELIAKKYRVERLVGRGGMGVVLAATHVQLGQTVAIKLLTLPPDEDRRDEAIARFLNEAQAAARLQNDHVVRIYDVGQLDDGLPFMVMELLSGQDLGTILDERGALPEPEAVDYVLQACAGIAEAHQLGVVHRDLKPSNLFVTRRSDGLPLLKVLDFGISKQLTDPGSGQALPTFTNTRTLMGSPNYMSPEQIRDARRVDGRTDIWAMGIILQELMTNAPVFHGESFPGVCAAIVADPPMPVRTMRPDVSQALEGIIERCLQKDVTQRFQSITELASALSPLGSRAVSGGHSQPVIYSSQTRLREPTAAAASAAPLPDDKTVAMPSSPDLTHTPGVTPARSGTLESARLATSATHSALSVPDSKIEIVTAKESSLGPRSRLRRLALPLALGALLVAGSLWFKASMSRVSAVTSADLPSPSAPPKAVSRFALHIDSDPSGASVSEGSELLGSTPLTVELSIPEGASPRVLVVEKDGFEPYVIRQGAAAREVRVSAPLRRLPSTPEPPLPARAPSAAVAPAAAPAAARRLPASAPPKALRGAPAKQPPATTPQTPSDIRLER